MRTLITGARGFIGRNLVDHLRRQRPEEEVFLLDRESLDDAIACDLTDVDATRGAVEATKPDRLFHLAGMSTVSGEIDFPQYFLANFLTTQNLLQALGERKCCFFLASSVHVYGSQTQPVAEDSEVHPANPYAYSKYLAEELIRQTVPDQPNLSAVIGRLYSCIGPGQGPGFVASDLCRKIAELSPGETLKTGPLSAYRRFLDVRDLVGILDRLTLACTGFEIVNVASPHELPIQSMLEKILKLAGVQPPVESTQQTGNTFRGLQLKTDKLHRLLDKVEFRPIESTLKDMYQATLENLPTPKSPE